MLKKDDMPFIKGGARIALNIGGMALFVLFVIGVITGALNMAPTN